VRFGIIGCSRVAERMTLPAIRASARAVIHHMGSRSAEKGAAWAHRFDCPRSGTYDKVLADPDVDAVYVSLPPALHEEWTVRAAAAGKHVVCEKPASTSLEAARKMVAATKLAGVGLLEGYMFRFHPQHQRVRNLIRDGSLGSVRMFSGRFGYPRPTGDDIRLSAELGGGVFNDAAGYPIYASRMLFEAEPEAVSALFGMDEGTGVDRKADLLLRYPGDRTAAVSVGFDMYFQSRYSVWGSEARVTLGRAYAVPQDRATMVYLDRDDVIRTEEIEPHDQFRLMIDYFCESTGSPSALEQWRHDLLSQARAMEAARRSGDEGRTVRLSELEGDLHSE